MEFHKQTVKTEIIYRAVLEATYFGSKTKLLSVVDVEAKLGGGGALRTPCIRTLYRFPVRQAMY